MNFKKALVWEILMFFLITITMWGWYLIQAPWGLLPHTIIYNIIITITKATGLWAYSNYDKKKIRS